MTDEQNRPRHYLAIAGAVIESVLLIAGAAACVVAAWAVDWRIGCALLGVAMLSVPMFRRFGRPPRGGGAG